MLLTIIRYQNTQWLPLWFPGFHRTSSVAWSICLYTLNNYYLTLSKILLLRGQKVTTILALSINLIQVEQKCTQILSNFLLNSGGDFFMLHELSKMYSTGSVVTFVLNNQMKFLSCCKILSCLYCTILLHRTFFLDIRYNRFSCLLVLNLLLGCFFFSLYCLQFILCNLFKNIEFSQS